MFFKNEISFYLQTNIFFLVCVWGGGSLLKSKEKKFNLIENGLLTGCSVNRMTRPQDKNAIIKNSFCYFLTETHVVSTQRTCSIRGLSFDCPRYIF